MTTLRKEAFLIKDRLAGGEDYNDNRTDVRDIMMTYRQVMREEFTMTFYQNMNVGDRSQISMYITPFELDVERDANNNFNIVKLSELYDGLPWNKGIVKVFPTDDPAVEIVRANNPHVSANLPWLRNMEKKPSYYIEGLKLVFREDNWEDWEKVTVNQLIPGPESLKEDDTLPILPGQMNRIREKVTNYFMNLAPRDELNDGNKDIGVTKAEQ